MDNRTNETNLNQLAESVLAGYGLVPEKLNMIQNKGLKTLWKVSYKDRTLCLKRLKHEKEKAIFSVYAQVYIYEKGGNVPRVIRNIKGEPIAEHAGQLFVLYEWIDGRDLDFESPGDLCMGVKGLSAFHKVSKGYQPPGGARESSKLGKWPKQYESMRKKMLEWKEEASRKSDRTGYRAYLKYADSMIKIADTAIDTIKHSSYNSMSLADINQIPLCHQDYGRGNALLAGQNVYVLDLDGVTYDFSVRDLRKIIGKKMIKSGGWDKDKISSILECYKSCNELLFDELELLKIDLLFPHWFFGEVKNIFQKNKLVKDVEVEKVAKLEESKIPVIEGL